MQPSIQQDGEGTCMEVEKLMTWKEKDEGRRRKAQQSREL